MLFRSNLLEAGLQRPRVKAADFHGKEVYLEQRARTHQPAYLCTLAMTHNIDSSGVARYPVGTSAVFDPATDEVLIDAQGRRSYLTSIAYGPSLGMNIALAYLPHAYCQVGRELQMEYFGERYPLEVAAVGYQALYDPENLRPKS